MSYFTKGFYPEVEADRLVAALRSQPAPEAPNEMA